MKIFITLLITASVFSSCERKPKNETIQSSNQEVAKIVKDDRPPISVPLTDGNTVNLKELNKKFMLILFQPDCDHCQVQARQISARLADFKDYQLYFISSEPMNVIHQFSVDYDLVNKQNVFFGNASVETVMNQFGSISTPAMYIYKEGGELAQSFDGITDVDVIVKYL